MHDPGPFLKRQIGAAGSWNCSTLPADWCISLGHPDFAARWRDVTGWGECEVPDLVAFWDEGIGDALPVVADKDVGSTCYWVCEPGDIGVVAAHGLEAGAIWTGERWALRMPRGLHFASPETVMLLKAWRP